MLKEKYNDLEKKNTSLIEEKKKHLEVIALLEETVQVLETRSQQKKLISSSTQTEDVDRKWCIECEYPAEDLYDLGEHMYEVHAEENAEYCARCQYCGIKEHIQRKFNPVEIS